MRAGSRQKCLIYKFSQFPPIIPVVKKERLITFCLQRFSLLSLARQMAAPGTVLFGNRKGQTKAGTRPAGGTNSKTEEAPGFPNETYLSACDSKIVCIMPLRVPGMMYVEWRLLTFLESKWFCHSPQGKKSQIVVRVFPSCTELLSSLTQKISSKEPLPRWSDLP